MLKIYRYTTNEYLEQWYKDDGTHSMVFKPVSKYKNIDNIRKDPLEGVAYYMPDETEITIGDEIFPCRDFRVGMSVENFMIACFSTVYSKELCDRFQADCVLEGEIEELEGRIDVYGEFNNNIYSLKLLNLNGKAEESIELSLSHIDYDDKTVSNSEHFTPKELFQKTLFTKCKSYAIENEFRIVLDLPQSLRSGNKMVRNDEMDVHISLKLTPVKKWKLLPKL